MLSTLTKLALALTSELENRSIGATAPEYHIMCWYAQVLVVRPGAWLHAYSGCADRIRV